jgi:hypothetical protein
VVQDKLLVPVADVRMDSGQTWVGHAIGRRVNAKKPLADRMRIAASGFANWS